MISTYIRHKNSAEAIKLFEEMVSDGMVADEFTYSSVFKAFSNVGLLREGRKAHGRLVVSGLKMSNVFVASALVDMYSKFGKMKDARIVSDQILDKDVVLMSALIVGYSQNGENVEALEVFSHMIKDGIRANDFTFSSILTACGNLGDINKGKQIHVLVIKSGFEFAVASRTALLTLYSKGGLLDDSLKVFDGFVNANVVTWTALITGLVQNGKEESALSIFCQMIRNSIFPNAFTFSTVLSACSMHALVKEGRQIHGLVLRMGLDRNSFVGAALVDMYGKCGIIDDARSVFDDLGYLNVVAVNSMIYGYAQNGYGAEAVKLFDRLQELRIKPDNGTLVSVLSACSNAGLLEEGRRIFSSMEDNPQIEMSRDHYGCMVDLLGRAGKLKEAETLVNQVKYPDVVLWRTLLSSCRIHGKVEMAERVMNRIVELEPGDEGAHTLMTNVYASKENWNEVTKRKVIMKKMKLKKNIPAMSWIEI
ncbi:hypothetical protein MKW94_003818 [Papaver nudicaule]|uniref:Pentatricopeptide repeat-containing protein n=1 Tax=Papaver nudicaule TaxID=74823 RepID=A0AA41S3J7_PAPNU|nr:hypothetical protein [Papaver nudicaule]